MERRKLDLIMVLGGEDTERRNRSRRALQLYFEKCGKSQILISGSHSGYLGKNLPNGMKKECDQSAEFLISQGIPNEHILREGLSLDTLGNFYFSYPMISQEIRTVNLVTDGFHMRRSLWCSNLVFGDSKNFIPNFTEQNRNTIYCRIIERLQELFLDRDMRKYGVKNGDYGALKRFMEEVHPFYCNGQVKSSMFGTMIKIFGRKEFINLLPTQRQASKNL